MDSFAKSKVEEMIRKYASVETVMRNFNGFDVFVLSNGVTIRLPADNSRIPIQEVIVICEIKLELSLWELDYLIRLDT